MFATEQQWSGVVTTNEKRGVSTSRERAVIRDLDSKIAHKKNNRECCGTGYIKNLEQDVFGQPFFLCSQLRMRDLREVQKTLLDQEMRI